VTRVAVLDHVFPSLDPERGVLEPLGIEVLDGGGLDVGESLRLAARADGILLGARLQLTRERLDALSNCRVIVRYGIGVNNVDLEAARERGIAVGFVPDYCVEEVANHAIALMLALHRRLAQFDARVREGEWGLPGGISIPRLSECSLGLVGAGRIGLAVAARAAALGMAVLVFDPAYDASTGPAVRVDHLETLLESSDVVSLHLPLLPSTRGILNAERIAAMKPGALLVNVSRGGLVDEHALVAALEDGRLAGAGIDTPEHEPLPADDPLRDAKNLLLTPHVAWFSDGARAELQASAAGEAGRVLTGRPLRHPA
jgi:D-3-phosphoglycerate dehydrogenase